MKGLLKHELKNMLSPYYLLYLVILTVFRLVQEAKDRAMLIDASFGRKTRAVIVMDTDHVVLSAITPEAIAKRLADKEGEIYRDEEDMV